MSRLVTTPNLESVDELYARLIEMHAGLTAEESLRANARLVLILVNHIGDPQLIEEAIELARGTARTAA
jgi:hypothetical protein